MSTLWQSIDIPKREPLKGEIYTECAVIGGGLAGIMTAFELKKRGFEVVLIEADRVLSGATKGTTAKITAQHGFIFDKLQSKISPLSARLYFESNKEAIDKIERLIFEENIDCDFERVPSYIFSTEDTDSLIKERMALARLRIDTTYVTKTGLPFSVNGAIRLENQAQFNPLKFASALSENLKIYEKTPALKISTEGVKTPEGFIHAKYTVICTHYPVENFPGLYFLRQHQERSYLLAVKTEKRVGGMYISGNGVSLRDYPEGVLIGGEAHRTGKNKKSGCYMELQSLAKKYFPEGEIVYSWSNQDVMTHDRLPFIGRYSMFTPNLFVATGFNKWGMSLCAVASALIPDLIEGKENRYEKLYTPRRINFLAALPDLLVDVGYSVKGLISGLFSEKEKRCSHLGCRLKENPEEGTLECPCHGSEFTRAGEVIFSPAKKPLKGKRLK